MKVPQEIFKIVVWFTKYGFVKSYGVDIDETITLGDLEGIVDQIDAQYRGWADNPQLTDTGEK